MHYSELDTRKFETYYGLYTSPAVVPFVLNYIYATTHHFISSSSSITTIIPTVYTITSIIHYWINSLSGRNRPVDIKNIHKFFLFKPENIMMNTLEAMTKPGGFNQFRLMRKYNKRFPYIGPHQHEDDAIYNFLSLLKYHDSTNDVELIVDTNTILVGVYAIGSNSVPNIAKFLQDRFCERGIPINIWSDNSQEKFMGSAQKLLHAYGGVIKQYESHKNNQDPDERRIQ